MPSPSAAPRRSLTLGHGSTRRDLRAPSHQPGGRRSKVSGEPPARGRVAGVSPLPPLAPFGSVFSNREAYAGPTDESNWVVPGRLMAGAYPGYDDDGLNYKSLFRLLEAGVTCFVCLQLAAWKSTGGTPRPAKTSNLSSSINSTSMRLMFGRIDGSRRVLEAQLKSLRRNRRIRAC